MSENLLGQEALKNENLFSDFQNSDWLNSTEAALYLRLFRKDGSPCVERIRNLVHQGRIPFYKPFGKLMFKRIELNRLVENTRKGGFNGDN